MFGVDIYQARLDSLGEVGHPDVLSASSDQPRPKTLLRAGSRHETLTSLASPQTATFPLAYGTRFGDSYLSSFILGAKSLRGDIKGSAGAVAFHI